MLQINFENKDNKPQEENKDKQPFYHKKIGINASIKYVSKVNYTLKFEFITNGKIQNNDLMGAIYNHGNHLFEDLTLEKLQNARKLGRFNIHIVHTAEGSIGEFTVPLLSDKIEASIVAANIESIEKCGPFTHKIKLKEVINEKSDQISKILDRAKVIYETKFKASIDSTSQLRTLLKTQTNTEKYILLDSSANIYGGPHYSKDTIYLVEGINDVKKLIQYNIYNTISVNGGEFNIEALKKLVESKEITILFDGDRGGQMLTSQIAPAINATYVVKILKGESIENIQKNVLFEYIYKNKVLYNITDG